MTHTSESAASRWATTIGWAVYLGVSWTWCIGMFLPILLVRDFGFPGYVAFAVPNVIGAAAMGWVIASPGASVRFVQKHRAACCVFGLVTALFHVAFGLRVIFPLDAMRDGMPCVVALVLGPIVLARIDRPRTIAAVTYAISVGTILALTLNAGLPLPVMDESADRAAASMRLPMLDVLFLVPACVFGFALCPYLDLTFHRARQQLRGNAGRWGFGLGFGVFFLSMILFTPLYQTLFAPLWVGPGVRPGALILGAVLVHLTAQSVATISFHTRELVRAGHPRAWWAISLLLVAVLAITLLPRAGAPAPPALSDPDQRLIWYRLFMSCYGLMFPAYVWLIAIPTADGHSGFAGPRGRLKIAVLVVSCLLAAPCFWIGFVERQTWWLGPGMAIVLFARLAVRSKGRQSPDSNEFSPAAPGSPRPSV